MPAPHGQASIWKTLVQRASGTSRGRDRAGNSSVAPAELEVPLYSCRRGPEARWNQRLPDRGLPVGRASSCAAACRRLSGPVAGTTSCPISDRRGASLMSGGDVELSYVACGTGLGIGIFPQLKVTHLIPGSRSATRTFCACTRGSDIDAPPVVQMEEYSPGRRSVVGRNLSDDQEPPPGEEHRGNCISRMPVPTGRPGG